MYPQSTSQPGWGDTYGFSLAWLLPASLSFCEVPNLSFTLEPPCYPGHTSVP